MYAAAGQSGEGDVAEGVSGFAFYTSSDGGLTWVHTVGISSVRKLKVWVVGPDSVHVYAAADQSVLLSVDRGRSWATLTGAPASEEASSGLSGTVYDFDMQASDPHALLVAAEGGLFRVVVESPEAATWTRVEEALTSVRAVVVDPTDRQVLIRLGQARW